MSRSTSPTRRRKTKDAARLRYCPVTHKQAFRSRKLALAGMNDVRSRFGAEHARNVYKCRHCRDWHMTSQEQRS